LPPGVTPAAGTSEPSDQTPPGCAADVPFVRPEFQLELPPEIVPRSVEAGVAAVPACHLLAPPLPLQVSWARAFPEMRQQAAASNTSPSTIFWWSPIIALAVVPF
jgi:hypothetical protein